MSATGWESTRDGVPGVGGQRAQWNRTIFALFAIVAVALLACLAAQARPLSSRDETARGIEQSNTAVLTLDGANAVYAGYVHRYLDGEVDDARVSARANVESGFRAAVQHVHGAAGRRLVERAHQQWLANDTSRGALSPSAAQAERLQHHAAIALSDNAVVAIIDRAATTARANLHDDVAPVIRAAWVSYGRLMVSRV